MRQGRMLESSRLWSLRTATTVKASRGRLRASKLAPRRVWWSDDLVIALGDDGGFTKGPAEIRVAELGATESFDFSGESDGAFDQAAIA